MLSPSIWKYGEKKASPDKSQSLNPSTGISKTHSNWTSTCPMSGPRFCWRACIIPKDNAAQEYNQFGAFFKPHLRLFMKPINIARLSDRDTDLVVCVLLLSKGPKGLCSWKWFFMVWLVFIVIPSKRVVPWPSLQARCWDWHRKCESEF